MNWSTWRLRLLANFELLCVRVLAGAELAPDRTGCIGNRNLSPLEWSEVLRLAEHHGVLPLMARNLIEDDRAEHGGGLPPEIERTLRSAYEANLRRSMWFAAELARIMQHFERRAVAGGTVQGVGAGAIALRRSGAAKFFRSRFFDFSQGLLRNRCQTAVVSGSGSI